MTQAYVAHKSENPLKLLMESVRHLVSGRL